MLIDAKNQLKIEEVESVAREKEKIELSPDSVELVKKSEQLLRSLIDEGHPVYGINTGYGVFSEKRIDDKDIQKLNRNLIISHAVGTGFPLGIDVVRAAILVRINTLAKGKSGVSLDLLNTLVSMINLGVTPLIPSQGSLGSSGDLCQLSHMALVATKDDQDLEEESGQAYFQGALYSGKKAMNLVGIKRHVLGPKEGLAVNNGATFSAAIAALAVIDAEYLLQVAEMAAALSMEALCGCSDAYDPRIHAARNLDGQIHEAKAIRNLIKGSSLIDSSSRVQDAYSLRCVPQVHGGVRDTVVYVKGIVEREINACTDNPLIFEPGIALSGGNFHGEPIALIADFLSIAMCELGAISERRTFRLTDSNLNNGLPPMLVSRIENAGINSGMMLLQYSAASLVLENQTLATPDSIRSLPTSAGQEDHNANAMTAARHSMEIINNVIHILSIELYVATRAIDLRLATHPGHLGEGTRKIYDKIRRQSDFIEGDTLWGREVEKIKELIVKKQL